MGLRASAAERLALAEARAAGRRKLSPAMTLPGSSECSWSGTPPTLRVPRCELSLAPLEQLGKQHGEIAIRTLATYLDQQGSIVRTAQALHLHRNAVTYRLRRITDLLGVDLDDPEQRGALLQLACRARLLAQ